MQLVLETERLILRPLDFADVDAFFEMDKNPVVHKYLWQTPVNNKDEIVKIIEYVKNQYQNNAIGRFATVLKTTNEFIGWTGIKFVNDHIENGNTNFYDYGYRLNERYWNKGYATEASVAWLNYGFKEMKIDEMNAYTHAENGASNHILQKIGMNEIQNYPDTNNIVWKWWQMKNPKL